MGHCGGIGHEEMNGGAPSNIEKENVGEVMEKDEPWRAYSWRVLIL